MRVLDETGENLGVFELEKAIAMAREHGTDLIEVTAAANPPVVRLINFDKWRYAREKEEKKERQSQKTAGLKHVQITVRAAHNDLLTKVHQLEKFIKEGYQIEIRMRMRGREKQNKEWAQQKLSEFLQMISIEYKITSAAKFGTNGMFIHIMAK